MTLFRHLPALALTLAAWPALAAGQTVSGLPSSASQTSPPDAGDARGSSQGPIRILAASAACGVATVRRGGKVDDLYWTNGPYNARVTTDEVDHYVDLNLVVKTTGYQAGDCIEATIQADDGEDVATGTKKIVLRGRVNEIGYVFFEAPMRRYTVILR